MSLMLLMPFAVNAQNDRLDRYPMIPENLNAVFADYCAPFASGIANTTYGQYFGQITPDKNIYGYGQYIMNTGVTVTGQFRLANFVFGIMMGTHIVKVGTPEHYISYDLTSGEPINIVRDSVTIQIPPEAAKAYRFVSLSYPSGDRYVGETVNGKRDGYGTYMYKNGDIYYGAYRDNDRYGWGALFMTNQKIKIQRF